MADQLPATQSTEDAELAALLQKANATPKLTRWAYLFLDKTNKDTFGNRTESAFQAYSLDRATQYWSAATIGKENYKKLQTLAADYYEQNGFTIAKQLDLLASKAVSTTNAKYLITMLEITGIYNPKAQTVIQNNTQVNIKIADTSEEEKKELNNKFKKFLEAETNEPVISNQSEIKTPNG